MKAIITGAGSGIGREIAKLLSSMNYETVLVGRNEENLKKTGELLLNESIVFTADISKVSECERLFDSHHDADVLVNCAGVGAFGYFDEIPLENEIEMINTNIVGLHTLTKLYYGEFARKKSGHILNVSSSAAYFSGPMYASYYATKAYVLRLSNALWREAKSKNNGVSVTVFCPGPVLGDFSKKQNIRDGRGAISPEFAAERAVVGMMKGRRAVYPDFKTRALIFISRFLPERLLSKTVLCEQIKKIK